VEQRWKQHAYSVSWEDAQLMQFEEVSEQSLSWDCSGNNSEGNLIQPQQSPYTSNLQNYEIKNMSCSKTLFQQK
jgi:hypothetical protein